MTVPRFALPLVFLLLMLTSMLPCNAGEAQVNVNTYNRHDLHDRHTAHSVRHPMAILKTQGRSIMNGNQPITLKGFNLGALFPMEPYMSPMSEGSIGKTDTYTIMRTLQSRLGEAKMRQLMQAYQETWITAHDFDNIQRAGFNLVRVPVWWGQFYSLDNTSTSGWRSDAFQALDRIVDLAEQHQIYVIIDLHGAIGSQSNNPSTGQTNTNQYWSSSSAKTDTAWMWWQIANHYKGRPYVAGYDLLNEPFPNQGASDKDKQAVLTEYNRLYNSIRSADPDHIIFIENTFGAWNWSMLPDPASQGWTNVVYESHLYQWPASGTAYDDDAHKQQVKKGIDKAVKDYANHASWNIPGYIGEFNPLTTDASVWRYSVQQLNQAGLHWSLWAYKSSNSPVPNFWGWYDRKGWVGQPDVVNDSADTIEEKWRRWTTANAFTLNSAVGLTPSGS